jgi:hypothetical protein
MRRKRQSELLLVMHMPSVLGMLHRAVVVPLCLLFML